MLDRDDNIAGSAALMASSTCEGYDPAGAVDGVVNGFPADFSREWASRGEAAARCCGSPGTTTKPSIGSGSSTGRPTSTR